MIKLIVSDIDGTLVKDGETYLNPEYFDVIRALQKKGITFVAASGRQYTSIRTVFEPIAATASQHGKGVMSQELQPASVDCFRAITEGGAMIYEDGRAIERVELPADVVDELLLDIRVLTAKGCDVMLSAEEGAYCPHRDSELYRWMTDSYRYDISASSGFHNLPRHGIVKVSIYHPFDCEGVVKGTMLEGGLSFFDKWSIDSTHPDSRRLLKLSGAGIWWVDCVLPTATKGTAVSFLQKRLGVGREETMAFGDNINDIEMLEQAEESYAVENARPETKKSAKYVLSGGFSNDGVLEVLKSLL